jgi:hypothetical protein
MQQLRNIPYINKTKHIKRCLFHSFKRKCKNQWRGSLEPHISEPYVKAMPWAIEMVKLSIRIIEVAIAELSPHTVPVDITVNIYNIKIKIAH